MNPTLEDFNLIHTRLNNGNFSNVDYFDLWCVEESLSAEEWEAYIWHFATPIERRRKSFSWDRASSLLHASIDEKIVGLAYAIRISK